MPSIPTSTKPKGQWITSPLLGAAAGVIGGISQGITNRKNRQWSEQQWQRQNAYNHPTAWRQRMQEAGINPFYTGQAGTAAGTITSPSTKASELDLGQYMTAQKVGNDTKVTNASVAKLQAETENQRLQNEILKKEQGQTFTDPKGQEWKGVAGLKGIKATEALLASQTARARNAAEILKIEDSINLINAQISNLNAQNLPYKVALEILDLIKDVTGWDAKSKIAVQKIKQNQ